MKTPVPLPDARYFAHEAMHTTFSLRILGMNESTARGIARECFEQINLLESRLSRYAEGSDVSRINCMTAGETLYLSETCHQCLLLALDAAANTHGLFDITLGTRIEHRKSGSSDPEPPLMGRLTIHPDVPAITCDEPGREIDLGGIGKGFALDQIKLLLTDWGVENALLTAGASSLMAIGPQSWPIDLTGDAGFLRLELINQSISASGTGIQGSHIIHPWGPEAMPVHLSRRIWVTGATAALAEIWSTALMLIDVEEIPDILAGNQDVTSVHADRGGSIEIIL